MDHAAIIARLRAYDPDAVLGAVGEDLPLGNPVEDRVVDLQDVAVAAGVEVAQVFDVSGAHAPGANLALGLELAEALDEHIGVRLAVVDVALDDIEVIGGETLQ